MFVILEGVEELWDPGTAVQSQDPPLLFMKNHLRRIEKLCNYYFFNATVRDFNAHIKHFDDKNFSLIS